ncbi:hypothetical protein ACFZC5_36570 [Nocardia gamkensis]|uniref:hypothetical protein n=1 Tax=Nocardia gamkensis TaxID=352869 RepID=UPI0036E4EC87
MQVEHHLGDAAAVDTQELVDPMPAAFSTHPADPDAAERPGHPEMGHAEKWHLGIGFTGAAVEVTVRSHRSCGQLLVAEARCHRGALVSKAVDISFSAQSAH